MYVLVHLFQQFIVKSQISFPHSSSTLPPLFTFDCPHSTGSRSVLFFFFFFFFFLLFALILRTSTGVESLRPPPRRLRRCFFFTNGLTMTFIKFCTCCICARSCKYFLVRLRSFSNSNKKSVGQKTATQKYKIQTVSVLFST